MSSLAPSLIEATRRAQQEIRSRPILIDLGVALLAMVLGLAEVFGTNIVATREPDALAVLLVCGGSLALVWRRSFPVAVLTIALAVLAVAYLRGYGSYLSAIGLIAVYSVAIYGSPRARAWIAVAVGIAALFWIASISIFDGENGYRYSDAAGMLVVICGAAVAGAVVKNRHEIFLDTEARADHAEADQAAAAERAVARERLRIAREMHDVVAHGMSVISVQAAAAQETFDTHPERTLELLQSIETTGRESLSEMRRMLGVLRNGNEEEGSSNLGERAPQPSLSDVEKLVTSCTDAGTPTELEVSGSPGRLSPGLDLAAYRIVQEALTNVLKHGGTAASVRVEVLYEPHALCLTITDTGRGLVSKPPSDNSGNGLIGMRERVEAYGGELSAGPRLGGGYEVSALLPTDGDANRPRVESSNHAIVALP